MPNKKQHIRGAALLGGLLLVLVMLAALPSTLAQYSSVEWSAGDTVKMASYAGHAEHTYTQRTLPVTLTAEALLEQVDTGAYSRAVVDAALAQMNFDETDVTCDATLVTLTAEGSASGYFAVQSSDGTTYYTGTVAPDEFVELTLPGRCEVTNDPEAGIIEIFDADGTLLLTVEARWGTPPDAAEQDVLGMDALQQQLDAELAALAARHLAETRAGQLQTALAEQQRLAEEQAAQEEDTAPEPEDGLQEGTDASAPENGAQEETEADVPEDGTQENGSFGQESV